ncbi:hypothetical protein RchiOBHm_Chr7g0206391 [Rosa chinensis]|uniref:Uncharacterized protein n=1 Tax=Rosa chinensis TaxID=74649 RepID=A0A2P6P958_ROSCH|nr:hypothetical protein RchiOBHm_Chr7g0206391 [Rosa chinensis]
MIPNMTPSSTPPEGFVLRPLIAHKDLQQHHGIILHILSSTRRLTTDDVVLYSMAALGLTRRNLIQKMDRRF